MRRQVRIGLMLLLSLSQGVAFGRGDDPSLNPLRMRGFSKNARLHVQKATRTVQPGRLSFRGTTTRRVNVPLNEWLRHAVLEATEGEFEDPTGNLDLANEVITRDTLRSLRVLQRGRHAYFEKAMTYAKDAAKLGDVKSTLAALEAARRTPGVGGATYDKRLAMKLLVIAEKNAGGSGKGAPYPPD